MKKQLVCLFIVTILLKINSAWASESNELKMPEKQPDKIPLLSVITAIPDTAWSSVKTAFRKDSIDDWALILGSTALLYEYDEDIFQAVQQQGRDLGIGNKDNTKAAFHVFEWPVRFPTDTGSYLYFMGDGITHFAVAGSFLGYGYFSNNNKAYNTGLQIVHGMTVSTIISQMLKRAFGRQSPNRQTEPRGAWRPFPSHPTYSAKTDTFDAMPSGHVMTATLTFTIIRENYPEYDAYLLPLEVIWIGALGWEMVNNGVHWASDYPLGIAMGYVMGKASARLGKKDNKKKKSDEVSWNFFPGTYRGVSTMNMLVHF